MLWPRLHHRPDHHGVDLLFDPILPIQEDLSFVLRLSPDLRTDGDAIILLRAMQNADDFLNMTGVNSSTSQIRAMPTTFVFKFTATLLLSTVLKFFLKTAEPNS